MKEMKRELQSILKNLNSLSQKADKLAEKVEKLEAGQAQKPSRAKRGPRAKQKAVSERARKVTAIDSVFNVIKRSRKGVSTTTLKDKTGFDEKKIWNIINRLKQQGRIKSERKGVYVKA